MEEFKQSKLSKTEWISIEQKLDKRNNYHEHYQNRI